MRGAGRQQDLPGRWSRSATEIYFKVVPCGRHRAQQGHCTTAPTSLTPAASWHRAHTHSRLTACLPHCLTASLPHCLPASLPHCLTASLPSRFRQFKPAGGSCCIVPECIPLQCKASSERATADCRTCHSVVAEVWEGAQCWSIGEEVCHQTDEAGSGASCTRLSMNSARSAYIVSLEVETSLYYVGGSEDAGANACVSVACCVSQWPYLNSL